MLTIKEKHGDEFKFKSKKYNFYAVCSKSSDTNFTVSSETSGFSLYSGGKYLGMSDEGKVLVYSDSLSWATRFYPVEVTSQNKLLQDGKKIAFKTSRGLYFYYDDNGTPKCGNYCDNAKFK